MQAQIYEQDLLPQTRPGSRGHFSYLPDRKFRGRVTYIYPTVDEKTRTARVRMEFHNPGYFLKPGMFATVELQAELAPTALLVPESAVLAQRREEHRVRRTGQRQVRTARRDARAARPRIILIRS